MPILSSLRLKRPTEIKRKLNNLSVVEICSKPVEILSEVLSSNKVDIGTNVNLKSVCSISSVTHINIVAAEVVQHSESTLVENLEREYISLTSILQSTRNELEELKSLHQKKSENINPDVTPSKSFGAAKQSYSSLLDDINEEEGKLFAPISTNSIISHPSNLNEITTNVRSPVASPTLRRVMSPFNDKNDAHLEYFFLTVLAMKQNSTHMDKLHFVNPLDLWSKAVNLKVEFKSVIFYLKYFIIFSIILGLNAN